MKKIVCAFFILLVIGLAGCRQETVNEQVTDAQTTDTKISTASISAEIDSITTEIANVNTDDTPITPISAEELD